MTSNSVVLRSSRLLFPFTARMTDDDVADIPQKSDGNEFLINLIDSPGHVDFSSEALSERIKPVCCVNKVDRALLELQISKEDLYQTFLRTVESVNVVIATYFDKVLGDVQVYPERGTVAFGSGLHGWCFTVRQFAVKYAKKFGVDKKKMMERLWGDNYFNPKTKKWSKAGTDADGKPLERAFCTFVLDPNFQNLCRHHELQEGRDPQALGEARDQVEG
ncbi:hypothetical protein MRB53_039205 [Persea americana]|nr:hypothetical protein MRB53_039205 [Persea americana]